MMTNMPSAFSVQHWLEICPQGYLHGTVDGHAPDDREPAQVLENEVLRERQIRITVQLLAGERCALAASSGLVNAAPDQASKLFLATQALDEARHVEIFSQRLLDLGVPPAELDATVNALASPHLLHFAEILLEQVDRKDFVSGVVGQNIVLEGMAFSVFELLHALAVTGNPKFARTLAGTIADERRHVGFGEHRIAALLRDEPSRKAGIERMQRGMTEHMLAAFDDIVPLVTARGRTASDAAAGSAAAQAALFRGVDLQRANAGEMQNVLADTVLGEFSKRLQRIGLEFQAPRA
jgi:hypothetical protein